MTLHMTISSFQKQLTTQITDFLATKVISESSKQAYAYDLKQFATSISGQIDQTSLKLYENQLKEWKPSVQKRKRSAVNQFLLYLYQKGELEKFFKLSETVTIPSQVYTRQWLYKQIQTYVSDCGLSNVTAQVLRQQFILRQIEKGTGAFELARLLGLKSPVTLEKYYKT